MHMPPPLLKNRYRLLAPIGQGGMGTVYRAHDEALDREVAIKFLPPQHHTKPTSRARFIREAQVIARLTHPNIMTIYDVDFEDIWPYLVLEYINGQHLHAYQVARGGVLSLEESLRIAQDTLHALAYAHGQAIIHRDIKPTNILITSANQTKVTDFGLAFIHGDSRMTEEGMIVGTLLYVAPEVILSAPIDYNLDLYALGCVWYEMLTGRPPYTGDLAAVISQILNAPIPNLRDANPQIPLEIAQIITKLLAKRPDERFQSAADVLERLSSWEQRQHPILKASPPLVDEETTESIALYTALEDTATALEVERRRLAAMLEDTVIGSLNLLLSQAGLYEQTLAANAQARTAASVLASLARQTLQQVRDLAGELYPALLENLGLEPALEHLAHQYTRTHGLRVELALQRMAERLNPPLELALYRLAQDALYRAVQRGRAASVSIALVRQADRIQFHFSDNGTQSLGVEALRASRQRLEQLGGRVQTEIQPSGGLVIQVVLDLRPPLDLTPREHEVLALLAQGLTNKQIAQQLSVSPRTVNFHLDNLYSKLGVNSRTAAVLAALRQGFIQR